MSNFDLGMQNKNLPLAVSRLSLLLFRYLKIFAVTACLTICCICILNTILPKSRLTNRAKSNSDLSELKNSLVEVKEKTPSVPEHDVRALHKVRTNLSLEQVRVAINEGTYSKLSILRPEILGDSQVKETSLLPEVKSLLLSRLKFLMTQEDWLSWKELLASSAQKRTPAREFVDNISTVNFQLGRYLETAGLLFSSLYLKTSNGSVFSAEQALYGLLQQSNNLFHLRAPKAISARVFLDTLITDDSIFISHLEELRSALIVSYARKEPNEIETQLILLGTVNNDYFSGDVVKIYTEILSHVNNKISPRFREEVRAHYFQPEVAKRLVHNNENLSSAIFNLYDVVISDSIERGDLSKAKSNYLNLTSFSDNSNALNLIQGKIDEAEQKVKSALIEPAVERSNESANAKTGIKLFPEGSSSSAIVSPKIQAYSLIVALIIFVMLLNKRFRVFLFALLVLVSKLSFKLIKRLFKSGDAADDLSDELDASIKAGKTVPMSAVPRNRQVNKRAANL